jgi:hypothetical protein
MRLASPLVRPLPDKPLQELEKLHHGLRQGSSIPAAFFCPFIRFFRSPERRNPKMCFPSWPSKSLLPG